MIIYTDTEQVDAEQPDHELIWKIHLLSQVLLIYFFYSLVRSYVCKHTIHLDIDWKRRCFASIC